MTTYLGVRIADDLAHSLAVFAHQLERSKNYVVGKAIERYLKEEIEEQIDDVDIALGHIALQRINRPNRKFYTTQQATDFLNTSSSD